MAALAPCPSMCASAQPARSPMRYPWPARDPAGRRLDAIAATAQRQHSSRVHAKPKQPKHVQTQQSFGPVVGQHQERTRAQRQVAERQLGRDDLAEHASGADHPVGLSRAGHTRQFQRIGHARRDGGQRRAGIDGHRHVVTVQTHDHLIIARPRRPLRIRAGSDPMHGKLRLRGPAGPRLRAENQQPTIEIDLPRNLGQQIVSDQVVVARNHGVNLAPGEIAHAQGGDEHAAVGVSLADWVHQRDSGLLLKARPQQTPKTFGKDRHRCGAVEMKADRCRAEWRVRHHRRLHGQDVDNQRIQQRNGCLLSRFDDWQWQRTNRRRTFNTEQQQRNSPPTVTLTHSGRPP